MNIKGCVYVVFHGKFEVAERGNASSYKKSIVIKPSMNLTEATESLSIT